MKKSLVCFSICGLLVIGLLLGFSSDARAEEFFDNFNDNNPNGWVFPYYLDQSQGPGDWSVEGGILVQKSAVTVIEHLWTKSYSQSK
jgi:hypothetical protein